MDDYACLDRIGRGRHSVVYRARGKTTADFIAMKGVDTSFKAEIENEVKILHRLKHPNIIRFHTWYVTSNHIWLILEYCGGGDMQTILSVDKRLPESTVKTFGKEIMAGLHHCHVNGFIYNGMKLSNILFSEFGHIKLDDFSMSRLIPKRIEDCNPERERGSKRQGYLEYMAPELIMDKIPSFASDIWAFGCLLYQLATGCLPFHTSDNDDLASNIATQDISYPDDNDHYSEVFLDLIDRMLEKDPLRRIQWKELITHDFWSNCELSRTLKPDKALPDQPLFNKMYAQRKTSIDEDLLRKSIQDISLRAAADEETRYQSHNDPQRYLNIVEHKPASPPSKPKKKRRKRKKTKDPSKHNYDDEDDDTTLFEEEEPSDLFDPAKLDKITWQSLTTHPIDSMVTYIFGNSNIEDFKLPGEANPNLKDIDFGFPAPVGSNLDIYMNQEILNADGEITEDVELFKHISQFWCQKLSTHVKLAMFRYLYAIVANPECTRLMSKTSCRVLKVLFKLLHNLAGKVQEDTPIDILHLFSCDQILGILGWLVRTSPDLMESRNGVWTETLLKLTGHKNPILKTRSMSILGELAYCIATMSMEQQRMSGFSLADPMVRRIVEGLHTSNPVACRHYAAKTIENIAAKGGQIPILFSEQFTVDQLISIYHEFYNKSEPRLKECAKTAVHALFHLCNRRRLVCANLFTSGCIPTLIQGEMHEQQLALNVVSLCLFEYSDTQRPLSKKNNKNVRSAQMKEETGQIASLMETIFDTDIDMLLHRILPSAVHLQTGVVPPHIRSQAILYTTSLMEALWFRVRNHDQESSESMIKSQEFKEFCETMLSIVDLKGFNALQKLIEDAIRPELCNINKDSLQHESFNKDPHIRQCVRYCIKTVSGISRWLLQITHDVQMLNIAVPVLAEVLSCRAIVPSIVSPLFIRQLARLLEATTSVEKSFEPFCNLVDSLISAGVLTSVVANVRETLLELAPALLILAVNGEPDARLICLRIILELLEDLSQTKLPEHKIVMESFQDFFSFHLLHALAEILPSDISLNMKVTPRRDPSLGVRVLAAALNCIPQVTLAYRDGVLCAREFHSVWNILSTNVQQLKLIPEYACVIISWFLGPECGDDTARQRQKQIAMSTLGLITQMLPMLLEKDDTDPFELVPAANLIRLLILRMTLPSPMKLARDLILKHPSLKPIFNQPLVLSTVTRHYESGAKSHCYEDAAILLEELNKPDEP